MAGVIESTNASNYRFDRIPVKSRLNIPAWCRRLHGYSNQRLIQYLTFGFPLYLLQAKSLRYTQVSNHFSATQYPDAIEAYLNKENDFWAILGPVKSFLLYYINFSPLGFGF